MASVRPMTASDLFNFNTCNLDHLTETYNVTFYLDYLAKWPHLCRVIEGHDGRIEGYSKTESSPYSPLPSNTPYEPSKHLSTHPHYLPFHGHITALTISPSARRLGYATLLTASLEAQCDAHNAWFVDLFVRAENGVAQELYRKMGYSVFRRVVGYYSGGGDGKGEGTDAFDMRKPLSRDVKGECVRSDGERWEVEPEDVW
ncbi:n-acetyltransferas-like protein [Tothia fuscella]|uniref:N-acetyltransferas-like protein n=1 Tax=Tothia fuscella TaxID=1048955 RepID=A0A9P4NGT2_9PEZI|nr:n-acetyltransferas-like protein [Tothia fuscella]